MRDFFQENKYSMIQILVINLAKIANLIENKYSVASIRFSEADNYFSEVEAPPFKLLKSCGGSCFKPYSGNVAVNVWNKYSPNCNTL